MKNKLKLLAKCILIPLELTATVSIGYAAIHDKSFGSCMTALTIAN